MKIAILLCVFCSLTTIVVGLQLVSATEAEQKYQDLHKEVERIAFGHTGSAELRTTLKLERLAEKNLFLTRDLGQKVI